MTSPKHLLSWSMVNLTKRQGKYMAGICPKGVIAVFSSNQEL